MFWEQNNSRIAFNIPIHYSACEIIRNDGNVILFVYLLGMDEHILFGIVMSISWITKGSKCILWYIWLIHTDEWYFSTNDIQRNIMNVTGNKLVSDIFYGIEFILRAFTVIFCSWIFVLLKVFLHFTTDAFTQITYTIRPMWYRTHAHLKAKRKNKEYNIQMKFKNKITKKSKTNTMRVIEFHFDQFLSLLLLILFLRLYVFVILAMNCIRNTMDVSMIKQYFPHFLLFFYCLRFGFELGLKINSSWKWEIQRTRWATLQMRCITSFSVLFFFS